MSTTGNRLPYLGFGLRLRREYVSQVIHERPPVDWFEVISESCLDSDGTDVRQLEIIRTDYPLVFHGISLAVGSPWPLNFDYLKRLKKIIDILDPAWISDHLCWSGADDVQGCMLPLPYTEDTLEHLVPRICEVQDFLGRKILLENVPMDRCGGKHQIAEAEFIREVANRSDSLILLDVANLHTTSLNSSTTPSNYLAQLPIERIQQIHLAGAITLCSEQEQNHPEADPLWELYASLLDLLGPISTMVERMDSIPPLGIMLTELEKARHAADLCASGC